MKATTACLLFASLLVNALPSPDTPAPTLLAAQIDSDCANGKCPVVSLSVLGNSGGVTTYALDGFPHSVDSTNPGVVQNGSPTQTLIEGPDGYTLLHADLNNGITTSIEDDCTFIAGGSSAANCVQHFGGHVTTVTSAKVLPLQTLTPLSVGFGAAPSSTKSGSNSNGGGRSGDVRGIGCVLVMVAATVVSLNGMW
ncbi:hypothetical protein DFH06DRAFT_559936 [Mycena polygramma]|nr:hypothetical protein DFH06DRAFT_559936 [Mycena polygramma]